MFSNKLSDNGLKIITDNVVCYSIIYLKKTQAHYPLTSRVSSTGWQREKAQGYEPGRLAFAPVYNINSFICNRNQEGKALWVTVAPSGLIEYNSSLEYSSIN